MTRNSAGSCKKRTGQSDPIADGIVRITGLVELLPPGALYLQHNSPISVVITKHRDTEAAEIPEVDPIRSFQSDNALYSTGMGSGNDQLPSRIA
jgi:hypothetical protein